MLHNMFLIDSLLSSKDAEKQEKIIFWLTKEIICHEWDTQKQLKNSAEAFSNYLLPPLRN